MSMVFKSLPLLILGSAPSSNTAYLVLTLVLSRLNLKTFSPFYKKKKQAPYFINQSKHPLPTIQCGYLQKKKKKKITLPCNYKKTHKGATL